MVTETDTGHEGPERPRGPTGGPLAATDGERRVGRALPRHGHALSRLGTHKIARCAARTFLRRPFQARGAGSSKTTSPENFLW